MATTLHGSARTTPRLRADLQTSKESMRTLAAKYGLNPKTVAKWRKRTGTADAPMGPRSRRTAALTAAEEAMVVDCAVARSCRSTTCSAAYATTCPS